MNAPVGALAPTPGQLALARLLADGGRRRDIGITHVDAAAYTDPARHAAEPIWRFRTTASASRC
jgi:glycine betaine catabolism A